MCSHVKLRGGGTQICKSMSGNVRNHLGFKSIVERMDKWVYECLFNASKVFIYEIL